jgi:hypothetical protein
MHCLYSIAEHIYSQGRVPNLANIRARIRAKSFSPHHSWTTRTPGRFP